MYKNTKKISVQRNLYYKMSWGTGAIHSYILAIVLDSGIEGNSSDTIQTANIIGIACVQH
jgi:hypothetical protein